ncbi:MAG: diphosphate--fructose-6-phosphate 1-phosphotransferase [Anaerolineae bacterium]|jgi:6-phosphofructokinase 1|nr:diphosphate--fructose-6-phosphate 1-phosphotransferase [Anaerolineae bacterium]
MMNKNVLVAQSGGPTAVINGTVRGIIQACKSMPDHFGTIYAGFHGIEGVLKEELIDMSVQPDEELALLSTTPGAGAIGTCRYKLKARQTEDFERVIEVLKAHEIGYFFYVGGNDSMDTAHKVSVLANERGLDLIATGGPKTIDNDVGDSERKLIDHTPGYGSVARYWALNVQNANQENAGSCPPDPVLVMQVMGRKIGYIPAAARLGDPKRELPLQIYMPESGHTLASLTDLVNDELRRSKRVILVVSEGFDVGSVGERHDSFGHIQYASSGISVAQVIVNHLNTVGIAVPGKARGQVAGVDQRTNMSYASTVDMDESYNLGKKAVEIALKDGNGYMSTILREPGDIYTVRYDKVPLELVANSEREFPKEWLAENGIDVTDDFVQYAMPLIGKDNPNVPMVNGLQRFARIKKIFAPQKLPAYVPQELR